ncbi:heparan-alpha-glucosaminide N-acetyltransferase domain-containing protein [Sediminicola arcticus]|jgi:uncharacterized membrane protein|uniref:Heparan-alpha-glucosaminide N-acetyltransferase domain-containing protein n=1 Tax=Sediminicola arcticus TaxID=1574308 RepID=A0ABV2SUG7_9FLAO
MKDNKYRLYFVDAMRAWAILMMLQGHFVDGLLDNAYRDNSNLAFSIWQYFRGITAPVFFTVSGFIFTYLLVRGDQQGFENPRVKKGIRRGLQLLLFGYILRLNLFGLLKGEIYSTFYLVDVLHCIGLSILGIIGIYLFSSTKKKFVLPLILFSTTIILFVLEPQYKFMDHIYLPDMLANYFTKANGSVFTIFPWFGYATFGAFLSLIFTRFKDSRYLYPVAITTAFTTGFGLILYSSIFVNYLAQTTGLQLFAELFKNNYLFIRLGNVLVVFGVFMTLRRFMLNSTVLKIGSSTLSIYMSHFVILYGSLTGLGFYAFLHHSLSPYIVIPGALFFMIACVYSALKYEDNKVVIKSKAWELAQQFTANADPWITFSYRLIKDTLFKVKVTIIKLFRLVKN